MIRRFVSGIGVAVVAAAAKSVVNAIWDIVLRVQ
jgi:hypothetical protein